MTVRYQSFYDLASCCLYIVKVCFVLCFCLIKGFEGFRPAIFCTLHNLHVYCSLFTSISCCSPRFDLNSWKYLVNLDAKWYNTKWYILLYFWQSCKVTKYRYSSRNIVSVLYWVIIFEMTFYFFLFLGKYLHFLLLTSKNI